MARALEAWVDGGHVGQFIRDQNRVRFNYNQDAPSSPISLSLPRDGTATKNAAGKYLDNLLPDNERVRERWSQTLNVPNEPMGLLSHMGTDVAGALVLLPEGGSLDEASSVERPAGDDEIADRILSIGNDPDAWLSRELVKVARVSMAGAQGKFTLAQSFGRWYWSSPNLPSTHILKPLTRFQDAPALESGSLALAGQAGIEAPHAESVKFLGQETFMVERFDRDTSGPVTRRIPTEDFAQALSLSPGRTYHVDVRDILQLLERYADPEQKYTFIKMLAFNTALGNADAHGKNYSVFLNDEVRLTPLYDSLPTQVWPELSDKLAMKIGGADTATEITTGNWAKMARANGLDSERVVHLAQSTSDIVYEYAVDLFRSAGAGDRTCDTAARLVERTTRGTRSQPHRVERTGIG
ncbi:HipA domain-containing protein [Glutamicibacter sp. NPDC087344]|uniref:HipA domain-containing protein n=1 Tax=Glutamicibacter sp. NPDC087344 TaxID=3363994 RepID=UPI00382E1B50